MYMQIRHDCAEQSSVRVNCFDAIGRQDISYGQNTLNENGLKKQRPWQPDVTSERTSKDRGIEGCRKLQKDAVKTGILKVRQSQME